MRGATITAVLLSALVLSTTLLQQAGAAERPAPSLSWLDGYTLVILDPGADLHAAEELIRSQGGSVAVVVPPRIVTGWIPAASDAALLGRAGIRSIHRQPLGAVPADLRGGTSEFAVRFFDHAVRRELESAAVADPTEAKKPLSGDAFDPGEIPSDEILRNLRAQGAGGRYKAVPGASLAGNSDYMTGTVSVTLFFVESDGTGSDPNLYNWTSPAEQAVFDNAVTGLAWWSSQARTFGSCWVAFYVHAYFATQDTRCWQPLEPVTHSSDTYATAISTVLGKFGYTSGSDLSRAAAFNVTQRSTYGTDWAYCTFVAANPTGPAQFTNGYSAWAYLGGPYIALLQRSFGWPFYQVFAHETGHIFRACDEYYQAGYGGCTDCGACFGSGVANGNCEYCNSSSVPCMMRANDFTLCYYTPGQIGWWRAPCSPPALPPPQLAAVVPPGQDQGMDGVVQIGGQNFTYGMHADFGADVQVLSLQFVSPSTLQATLRISVEAAPGWRNVVVRTPDMQSDTLVAGFQVRTTTRHYVSSQGGNTYPYNLPARAGTSLATVLAACSTGDSLLVAGGSYTPFEVTKTIAVLGGWTGDFASRDPQAHASVVRGEGSPVIRLTGTISPTLDGLVIRGGGGAMISDPLLGLVLAGGGVLCFQGSPTLRGCVIDSCMAGNSGWTGVGGGGFFRLSSPVLENCTIRGNKATRGGGLFFLQSPAQLAGNLIERNEGISTPSPAWGAGVGALQSPLVFHDDVVRRNTGAAEGGGLHVEDCGRVDLTGVQLADNACSGSGGAILARGSHLELRACSVVRNASGNVGGGVHATGDTLGVESGVVAGNTASVLGGGIYASDCLLTLQNATLVRNSGGYGSGLYGTLPRPGATVRNSIVAANSFGGLVFTGGTAPALDWNLVWSNGGLDYLGATPGANDESADPRFVNADSLDLHLAVHSPAIDAGDTALALADPDGSRNDRGAYGGPGARPAAPPRVQGPKVTAMPNSTVKLNWRRSVAPDVAWYAVYRDTNANLRPSLGNFLATVTAPDTVCVDPSPVGGGWYLVSAVDASGYAGGYTAPLQASPPTDVESRPQALALHAVAPNPANPGAWVQFDLPEAMPVRLDVYSTSGRRLQVLAAGQRGPGPQRVFWNGRDAAGDAVPSGVYWVRLVAGGRELARKLVLVR